VRKQGRNAFIHQLITADERDWDRIRQAVQLKNAGWATKKGQLVTVKALRNGYTLWLQSEKNP
jgi:hypothetical protein